MTEHVVGDWKNFTFEMLTSADFDNVKQHVRDDFLRYEVMNIMLGWCEENAADHDRLVLWALSHELSVALYKKGTKDLVALNLILNGQLGEGDFCPTSKICKTIFNVLENAVEGSNEAFRKNFDATNYAEIFITSVDKEYGGQGIASEMYRRTLKFLKAKGFTTVKSGFTSPATRAIGNKLNFCEIGRTYLNTFANEEGGKTFPTAGEEDFIKEAAKTL